MCPGFNTLKNSTSQHVKIMKTTEAKKIKPRKHKPAPYTLPQVLRNLEIWKKQLSQFKPNLDDGPGYVRGQIENMLARGIDSRVKIEVSGGVAECTACPDGITVEIQDHDNERTGN